MTEIYLAENHLLLKFNQVVEDALAGRIDLIIARRYRGSQGTRLVKKALTEFAAGVMAAASI